MAKSKVLITCAITVHAAMVQLICMCFFFHMGKAGFLKTPLIYDMETSFSALCSL